MFFFGGLEKTTLVDYPGKIAATVFTLGCNFRCPFCQNPELVKEDLIKQQPRISEEEVINFLKKRRGLLEGLCLTGGEPLLWNKELRGFLKKIKELGFLIKLDHNGSFPEELEDLIDKKLVDYVAMDVKAPKNKYYLLTEQKNIESKIEKSINLLKEGKIDYEFRTTLAPFLSQDDLQEIINWIKPARAYYLQLFRSEKVLDQSLKGKKGLEEEEAKKIIEANRSFFEIFELR